MNAVQTCILRQKINETYDCSYQFFLKIAGGFVKRVCTGVVSLI